MEYSGNFNSDPGLSIAHLVAAHKSNTLPIHENPDRIIAEVERCLSHTVFLATATSQMIAEGREFRELLFKIPADLILAIYTLVKLSPVKFITFVQELSSKFQDSFDLWHDHITTLLTEN